MVRNSADTVRGAVSVSELGITICHEHILVDLTCFSPEIHEASQALWESPVRMEHLGELRRNPFACRDNMMMLDPKLAIDELMYYKRSGGKTIVDCTSIGLGRDVRGLRMISEATGLNIISGTGFYVDAAHPEYVKKKSIDELADQMIREVRVGVDDSGIKCGIIGEVGTSWPVTPNEEKVVRAAVRAQQKTKAPVNVHVWPWGKNAHAVVDILEDEGADMNGVVLSHIDESGFDPKYPASLAKRGCYVEFDSFGQEGYFDTWGIHDPNDADRVRSICKLIEQKYLSQILLSQDFCMKMHLRRYGGYGFDHLLTNIVPMFRRSGLTEEQINTMFVENPKRLLGF
jgi:phosphotriesterase-related protein